MSSSDQNPASRQGLFSNAAYMNPPRPRVITLPFVLCNATPLGFFLFLFLFLFFLGNIVALANFVPNPVCVSLAFPGCADADRNFHVLGCDGTGGEKKKGGSAMEKEGMRQLGANEWLAQGCETDRGGGGGY